MQTLPSDIMRVACRECGMVMTARREHAGRRAACVRCKAVIVLAEAPSLEHPTGLPAPKRSEKPSAPRTTSVSCHVCGTRMSFGLRHVGRKAECPDCGAKTVIPPPPPPAEPKVPPAMEGEQYAVWESEDQPWGVDLARASPAVLKVACHVCQTLIDASPDEVGKHVTCHDCGAKTLVKPPRESKPPPRPNPAQIDAYAVEPQKAAPPPGAGAWLDVVVDPKADNEFATAPRPELPRWPMITGVLAFARSEGV
ncbi:MAG: hypothetical protein AAGG46_11590, partial [Planctomycetota bacterium]